MSLEREIKNLEFAVDTCFPWMRHYYRNRLAEARYQLHERETKSTNLDLCYKHRQEQNRSHFSEHNCDYCQLLEKAKR